MSRISTLAQELQKLRLKYGPPIVANFELNHLSELQIDDIAVHGYVRNREKRVLLVKHRTHGDRWLPPGGHPNPGESFEAAIVREILEETGLSCKVCRFLAQIWLKFRGIRYVLLFFDLLKQSGKLEIRDMDGDIVDVRFFKSFPENYMYELDKVILAALGYSLNQSPQKVGSEYDNFRPFIRLPHY